MKIACRIRRDTPGHASIGIESPHKAGEIIWLPRSKITIDECDGTTGKAIVDVPEWLVTDRGIEVLAEDS